MQKPLVSILIVTYNSSLILGRCLDSIAGETKASHEIIVVDNASSDGTSASVAQEYPAVHVIANRENYGFAVAVNQAASCAQGKYLLLLNPDTIILDSAIDRLLAHMETHPNTGIAAPVTLNIDRTPNQNSQPFYTPNTLLWTEIRKGPLRPLANWVLHKQCTMPRGGVSQHQPRDSQFKDTVYGCALMISAALYARLGGLDERYFMYEEDLDLCLRVKQAGYNVACIAQSAVIHVGGASSPVCENERAFASAQVATRRTRSRFLYAQKHFSPWFVLLMRLIYAGCGISCYLGALTTGKPTRTRRRLMGQTYLQTAFLSTARESRTLGRAVAAPAPQHNAADHNQDEHHQSEGV